MKGENYGLVELCINWCRSTYYCHCGNNEEEVLIE